MVYGITVDRAREIGAGEQTIALGTSTVPFVGFVRLGKGKHAFSLGAAVVPSKGTGEGSVSTVTLVAVALR